MEILIKTKEQIDGIRASCKLAARSLKWIENQIRPGISTGTIDRLLEGYIRDHKAIPASLGYHGFPKATCISLNEVICHGIPSDQVILKEGDIVNVDVTTILDGYYGDCSSMYVCNPISKDAERLLKVSKRCLDIGIGEIRPGNYFGNIGYKIMTYANTQRCTVVHQFCGHGVGIAFHEEPCVSHVADYNSGPKMQSGMIFTVEPMINLGSPEAEIDRNDKWTVRTIDGRLSAQFEHTVLVSDVGFEILTVAE